MNSETITKKFNSKKTITIYAGEEYKLHVADKSSDYNEDLFYETYKKAIKEVVKIIDDNKYDNKNNVKNEKNNILEMSNNIIAFCGERGQGKSSAMISFSRILENLHDDNIQEYFGEYTEKLNNKTFYAIRRIDPTELENQQSILNVIISRIFFVFKETISKNKIDNFYEKNELLKLFQKCFRSVNLIKEKKQKSSETWFGDDLELLSSLGDNAEIKNNLSELINKFLQFVVQKDYLIVQIDDSDLNVKNAYSIAEDIRKYLMIPNVIILMATKFDQFGKAVEQEYADSFKLLADAGQISYHEFYKMATKYISKLIPGTRKINLPDLSLYSDTEEFDYHLKYIKRGNKPEDNETIIDSDLQNGLLDFIYQKTGLIFLAPSNYTHNIVPNTMRELVNLLSVLNNLQNLDIFTSFENMKDINIIERINNLQVFEKYFLDSWMEENVDSGYHQYIRDWYKSSWRIKNSLLIYYLSETLKKIPETIITDYSGRASTTKKISVYNEQLENSAFSYGNSLDSLDRIDMLCPLSENYKFTFAIRTLYSINLNKFILQRILAERNGDYSKLKDISEYIVSIFGEEINDYVPKQNRVRYRDIDVNRNRAFFTKDMTANEYDKLKSILIENNEKTVFDLFFSCQEQNVKRNSIVVSYNISLPLIKILLHHSNMPQDKKFYDEYFRQLRYMCFCIISNSDVLHKIKNSLQIKNNPGLSSGKDGLLNHIKNFYSRISKSLESIHKINSEIDFNRVIEYLQNSGDVFDMIYNRGFIDIDSIIKESIQVLQPFHSTKTTELLNERLKETKMTFSKLYNYDIIDTRVYLDQLTALEHKRNLSNKQEIKESTCLEYQASINKLRKSVKEKLMKMVD